MAPDKILLEGMVFYGFHGAKPEEQVLGQRFIVAVTSECVSSTSSEPKSRLTLYTR